MAKATTKLQSTSDYSRFELCDFNRSVTKKRFLAQSMKDHGFIPAYPIHTIKGEGNRLLIKGGHHRFEVAQELGLPVYFVVSDDTATVHELEKATTRWSLSDFLQSFVKCGREDYAKVAAYHERTGIPLHHCVSMFAGQAAGSHNHGDSFKYGSFEIKDETHANAVGDIVLHCIDHGVKASRSVFVQSVSRCLFVEEFDVATFKARVASNPGMLKPCRSVAEQMKAIEEVYNYRAQAANRVPLVFLANKVMASRGVMGVASRKTK